MRTVAQCSAHWRHSTLPPVPGAHYTLCVIIHQFHPFHDRGWPHFPTTPLPPFCPLFLPPFHPLFLPPSLSRDWGTNQIARKALFTWVVYTNTRNTTIAVPLVEEWFTCIIDIPFHYSACQINTTIVHFFLTSNITLNAIWYWFNPKIIPQTKVSI